MNTPLAEAAAAVGQVTGTEAPWVVTGAVEIRLHTLAPVPPASLGPALAATARAFG